MGTNAWVTIPDDARDESGVISMSAVLSHLLPEVAALRGEFFAVLAEVVAEEPAIHELNRIATAEDTGCRYCRNIRRQDAMDRGVDEDAVERVRAHGADAFEDGPTVLALRLGERLRGYPVGADDGEGGGAAPEYVALAAHDARLADAVVIAVTRAVADGKAIVGLGLEPVAMPVRVV